MHIEELIKFGLSEKEALVYVALLELEVATVHEIAHAAKVNRSSAYIVLDSLQKRGLVSMSAGTIKRSYIAASPEKLLRLAEKAEQEKTDAKQGISAILPDLKSLYKGIKQKPRIQIFTGKEGLISVFESSLMNKEKLLRVASSPPDIQKNLPDYLPRYMEERIKLRIKMRGIHPYEPIGCWLREHIAKEFDEMLLIPKENWNFQADFAIYDNTVIYMNHTEHVAIVLESKAFADGMKKIFDLAFEEAKRLNIVSQPKRKRQKS